MQTRTPTGLADVIAPEAPVKQIVDLVCLRVGGRAASFQVVLVSLQSSLLPLQLSFLPKAGVVNGTARDKHDALSFRFVESSGAGERRCRELHLQQNMIPIERYTIVLQHMRQHILRRRQTQAGAIHCSSGQPNAADGIWYLANLLYSSVLESVMLLF